MKAFLDAESATVEYVKSTCLADEHGWVTMQNGDGDAETDLLQEVFLNGELKQDYTFADIRERVAVSDEEAASFDLPRMLEKLGLVTE